MAQIDVLQGSAEGSPLPGGFGRRLAFETDNVRVGETRVGPLATSSWHHHGGRILYGFVVEGQLTLEFGPRGTSSVRPSAGDFFRIPVGLVHRDVNSARVEAIIVNVMVGEGPTTVEVGGPED